jgi:hypothetical protein
VIGVAFELVEVDDGDGLAHVLLFGLELVRCGLVPAARGVAPVGVDRGRGGWAVGVTRERVTRLGEPPVALASGAG